MGNKVKMLEDKLSGEVAEEHAAENAAAVPTAVAVAAPMATPYDAAPISYKQPMAAGSRTPGADDNETSFTDNRPSTSSSQHGARPKTPKAADPDDERPDTRRLSMALPYVAE